MIAIFTIFLVFLVLAGGLAWYFVSHDRGEKEPIGALWIAAIFGVAGVAIAVGLETWLIPSRYVTGAATSLGTAGATLGIGAIEEICKFLPLALFIYHKRYFNEHTDGVIYFAIAGLGFGLPENILYTSNFGAKAGLMRIVMTPFFHAATTSMVGYFLIKAKLKQIAKWQVGIVLILAILMHALYDFGLFSGVLFLIVLSLMITSILSTGMFLFYMRAGELDRDEGLSAPASNNFCTNCGASKRHHGLFCTQCGAHA